MVCSFRRSTENKLWQLYPWLAWWHTCNWAWNDYGQIGAIRWQEDGYSREDSTIHAFPWWRHQMETFSVLLALCTGNSPVTGEFHTRRPLAQSFDISFDLRLNKWLSKQSWRRWFETPLPSLWRHCNVTMIKRDKRCYNGCRNYEPDHILPTHHNT